jgi:hypothetical protein
MTITSWLKQLPGLGKSLFEDIDYIAADFVTANIGRRANRRAEVFRA